MVDRIQPGPGQESVWDYPRPPRVEPTNKLIQVTFNGILVAETRRALRVLETSHPPVYYLPREDVEMRYLTATPSRSYCEFKGMARYWTIRANEQESPDAAWSYEKPAEAYASIAGHLAFYAGRVDACYLDGIRVQPQAGDFYGGWITPEIVGPFKGVPGSQDW